MRKNAGEPKATKLTAAPMIPRHAVSPMMVSLAAPAAPKAKAPVPRAALVPLMGDLAPIAPMAQPGILKVELPPSLDGQDIEIFVQIRQGGRTLAEARSVRATPAAGTTSRLTLELKRG